MKRALVIVAGWLLLISGLFSTVTAEDLAAEDTLTLYLLGNGVSWADLGTDPPPARALPNYDASRNTDPGLTIRRGGSGFDEWGWDKYQAWYSTTGGYDLNGEARLYLWSAVREFRPVQGSITAYLMACNGGGGSCELIETSRRDIDPWSGGDWEEQVLSFGTVTTSIASNQRIAVKLIVSNASSDDMWLAYDTATYDSRLVFALGGDVEPTTTTTTTTTTRPPTTTTTKPPTVTTTTTTQAPIDTTTTTRAPVDTTSTTTTTRPPTTTTTQAPGVTTTTLRPTTTTTRPPPTNETTTTTTRAPRDDGLPVPTPQPPDTTAPPPPPSEEPGPTPAPVNEDDGLIVALPEPIDPALALAFRTPSAEPARRVPVMVGLSVGFRSVVEHLRINLLPALILSALTAWLMMLGLDPRRRGTGLES